MGNTFSSSNNILVQLEQPSYYPGDTVKGVVALNCLSNENTSGIELLVEGYEESSFSVSSTETGTDGSSNSVSRHFGGRVDFFKVTVPLGPPGSLPAGQYQFGFQFMLPKGLPGTFYHSRGGDRGEIKYKAKAFAHKSGFDIKGEQNITVLQRVIPSKSISNATTTTVNSCCCFSKGTASIQGTLDKDAYSGGETVILTIQCQNNSTAAFSTIEAKLKRRIVLKHSAGYGYNSQHWTEEVLKASTNGVGPNEVAEGGTARQISVVLPANISPSTSGQLVTCNYFFEICLKASGMFVSSIKLNVPCLVNSGPPEVSPSTYYNAPPSDWKPSKVFNDVQVELPEEVPSAPPAVDATMMQGGAPQQYQPGVQQQYPAPVV